MIDKMHTMQRLSTYAEDLPNGVKAEFGSSWLE